jgi:hypothetical protein
MSFPLSLRDISGFQIYFARIGFNSDTVFFGMMVNLFAAQGLSALTREVKETSRPSVAICFLTVSQSEPS